MDKCKMIQDAQKRRKELLDLGLFCTIVGPRGPRGEGINIIDYYKSEDELLDRHPLGKTGDAYLVNSNIFVWSENDGVWKDAGSIKGEKGDKGDKGDKGEDYTEVLVTTNVSDGKLALTSDKYQYTTLSNSNTITLPSVSKFTQIHLFFEAKTELTLTFPAVKWQKTPDIQALKTYEFIFTYVNGTWLGGWIAYE